MDAGIDEDSLGSGSSLLGAASASSYLEIPRSTEEVEFLQDDGFMASLESGGTILNSGRWSVSASARGESVQWSVVNEDLLDPWIPKQVGPIASSGRSPAKAKSSSTDLSGIIKPDPGEEWVSAIMMQKEESSNRAVSSRAYSPPSATSTETKGEPPEPSLKQTFGVESCRRTHHSCATSPLEVILLRLVTVVPEILNSVHIQDITRVWFHLFIGIKPGPWRDKPSTFLCHWGLLEQARRMHLCGIQCNPPTVMTLQL